jgi:alkylhydroperoxidase/carboxymuconolactone decarboxylase family protein YurZ
LGVSRQEILEATAVAVALCGAVADWPARYVFKILEDIENEEKEMEK